MNAKVNFTYKFDKDTPLKKIIKDSGVKIKMPCKKGTCGKCIINIKGSTNKPTKNEIKYLSKEQLENGYRLACEVKVLGDINIKMK